MATFQIDTPDGKSFEVEAPTEAMALQALGIGGPAEKTVGGFATRDDRERDPSQKEMDAASREKDVGSRMRNLKDTSLGGFAGQYVKGVPFTADVMAGINTPVRMAQRAYQGKDQVGAGEDFSREKEAIQRTQEGYQEQNPVLAIAGQLAGGMSLGGPRIGPQGTLIQPAAQTALKSAGVNAAVGGAYGANEGDTLGERLSNAGVGMVAGGALGYGAGRLAERAAAPGVAAASNPVVDAGAQVGVNVPRFLATDSKAVRGMAQAGRQSPIGGARIEGAAQGFVDDVGAAASRTAKSVGSGDAMIAGEAASGGLKRTITETLPKKVSAMYDKVDALINPTTVSDLAETSAVASDIAARRAAAGLTGNGKAVDHVLEGATRPGGLTYAGVKDLRTSVGEMLKGGILPEGMSGAELKQLYASLTRDVENSVKNAGGPAAQKAWQRANQYAAAAASRKEKLAKIVGAKGDNRGELVYSNLMKMAGGGASSDLRGLNLARRSMHPDEWNEVVSSAVDRLGRTADGSGFSADKFLTEFQKMSKEGKAALFGGNPQLESHLKALETLAARSKDATKMANHSNTGRTVIGVGLLSSVAASPIATIAGALGAEMAARVLSKPATAAAAVKWANTVKGAQMAGASGAKAASRASNQFGVTIARELGIPQAANDIGTKLMGVHRSAADDEGQ